MVRYEDLRFTRQEARPVENILIHSGVDKEPIRVRIEASYDYILVFGPGFCVATVQNMINLPLLHRSHGRLMGGDRLDAQAAAQSFRGYWQYLPG